MAKYLANNAGQIKEVQPITTSAGAGDASKVAQTDSTGRFDVSLMPVSVAPEVTVCPSSENLAAGDWVNLYDNAGTINARKADATTNAKPADGFVLAAVTSPASATVYRLSQTNTARTGMTVGVVAYLSTTAGGMTTTAPSATGNIVQRLGKPSSATEVVFDNVTYFELV